MKGFHKIKMEELYLEKVRLEMKVAIANVEDMKRLLFLLEKDFEKKSGKKWVEKDWASNGPGDLHYYMERLIDDYKAELFVWQSRLVYFESVLNEK
jgi:hypothetical protein